MIRVLIVDDSPTLRLLLKSIITSSPEFMIVGEAINGKEAIKLCQTTKPDIITMDIEMPGMDGYEAIKNIMSMYPCPIVVLTSFASHSKKFVEKKAIEAGAVMVLGKPVDLPGIDPEADKLINHLKAMSEVKVIRRKDFTNSFNSNSVDSNFDIIAIGASTGGPPALHTIFKIIKRNLPVPILVVQHISEGFINGLSEWLKKTTGVNIKLAESGEYLKKGTIYLARDDQHLVTTDSRQLWLDSSSKVDGHRPSATKLFSSVAKNYKSSAIGIVLTGMGNDGASGLLEMRNNGAMTIAQDESSCVVYGMPKEAALMGAAKKILPLDQIGGFINDCFR